MSLVGLGSLDSAAVIDRAFQGFSANSALRAPDRRIFSADAACRRWRSISSVAAIGRRRPSSVASTMRRPSAPPGPGLRILYPRSRRLADLRDQLANSAARHDGDGRLDAVGKYALLLAAGSCIGTWSAAAPDSAAFASEWLASALLRIESRITGRRSALTGEAVDAGMADIAECVAESCSVAFERSPIFPSACTLNVTRKAAVCPCPSLKPSFRTGSLPGSSPTARSRKAPSPSTPRSPSWAWTPFYALTLCGDIEDAYGIEVDPLIVWDYPTIRELAGGLAEQLREAA